MHEGTRDGRNGGHRNDARQRRAGRDAPLADVETGGYLRLMTVETTSGHERDAALLAAYAAGDARAARTLIETHAPRAMALARRMLGNSAEAEEIAQEAMLRLWRIAPEWRAGEARISTWLYRVVANLCTDRLRKVRTQPLPEGHDPPDERPGPVARLIDGQRVSALEHALAELPERQRVAVTLRHLEERSNGEIAEIMGLTVDAVESLQARGRRRLRDLLSGAELSYNEG